MKVLVTGAGGFIGFNLFHHLKRRDWEVIGTVRPGAEAWRIDQIDDTETNGLHPLDLSNLELTREFVRDHAPDAILHIASHGAYSWQEDFGQMLRINTHLTEVLLDSAEELGASFVYAGSSSEYGFQTDPIAEAVIPKPNSLYAVSKNAGTTLVQHYAREKGVNAVALRLFSVYGPWEERNRLIPKLVANALSGGLPPLVAPEVARDFVYIDDICRAFERALNLQSLEEPFVFNIGSGVEMSLGALVATVRSLFAVKAKPDWGSMEERNWDTDRWCANPTLAEERLDWRPETPLEKGLAGTAQWLEASGLTKSFL